MKKLILIPFIFLLSLVFVNAFDCNVSSQTSINQGTNISIAVSGGNKVAVNDVTFYAEIYMYSAGQTQNISTTTLIANVTNSTLSNLNFTMLSYDSLILQDGSDYTIGASVWNGTANSKSQSNVNYTGCTNVTNRNLDRTKPTKPSSITYTNPLKDGNTITATINRSDSNRCFIRFGGQNVERKAMTLSGSTCTFTVGRNNPPNSDYQSYIVADDRTNETNSIVNNIIIRATVSDGGGLFGDTIVQDGSLTKAGGVFGKVNNKTIAFLLIASLALLYLKNKK